VFAGISEVELIYRKNRTKRYKKVGKISKSRLFKSIEERPETANERSEYGHWEIDLVKGKLGMRSCLLTLSERLTRQEIIIKLKRGKVEEVDKALTTLEKEYGNYFSKMFKTITADNGSEFLDWERLEESKLKPGT
jgi:IS30 family transposase